MPDTNRANASSLKEATQAEPLPVGFREDGNAIICPSGLRWTLQQDGGFDVTLRGNTIHVPYEEFMVVDKYLMHQAVGISDKTT